MTEALTVGQVADRLGISAHTLRYYESEGLLGDVVARNSQGHRRYSEQAVLWVRLLQCLRDTGMPIAEVKRFADMAQQGLATLAQRLALIRQYQALLDADIERLQQARAMLSDKEIRYEQLLLEQQNPSNAPQH
ncbi:MAG: transcriptional regulator, MerR family [Nocardia sp.]|uniref:MerR family transcriptional regulator n=1 Tax=Nocardia sp. TaxID=1821 RepID=UPI0026215FA0|nr:MerR family transcriptional regulator [Nocardia sp.]MCU1645487.1 transcriptional regulator, MerR family [Nocardia sp.]